MGGNAKYRYHTAVIRNRGNESGVQEMRDANGDLIRIRESERVVGKNNRTSANRQNARERMLNAKAMNQVRDLAKEIRQINKELGSSASTDWNKVNKALDNYKQLGALANQIQPGAVSDNPNGLYTSSEIKTMEKLLGIKLT